MKKNCVRIQLCITLHCTTHVYPQMSIHLYIFILWHLYFSGSRMICENELQICLVFHLIFIGSHHDLHPTRIKTPQELWCIVQYLVLKRFCICISDFVSMNQANFIQQTMVKSMSIKTLTTFIQQI